MIGVYVSNKFNTPSEVTDLTIASGVTKANLPFVRMFLLAILAGAFIAFGACASSLAMHDVPNIGLARLIAGFVFPVGLMMIVLVGGELFTGNCLMVEALVDKKIKAIHWLRNLVVVWIGNLVGSILIVALVIVANQYSYTDGALGAFTIKVALGKATLPFWTAFGSAILCNILVCVAVVAAMAARDVVGKIFAIFFPIMAFVLSGFEHSVANMYYISAGIAAKSNTVFAEKATELYGISAQSMQALDIAGFFSNLIPVTLGNVVGGVALGLLLYFLHKKKDATEK
ncbi:MAG: formate/nitrite transporter family protein [Coriobacteriaceae bacterium]|nr:formate/nitrite transporter family protein [Coriobacteriaceae bacterium]